MTRRPLLLAVGQAYVATDFEGFAFLRDLSAEVPPTLRIRLANGVTIDVEPPEAELKRLAALLARIYPT